MWLAQIKPLWTVSVFLGELSQLSSAQKLFKTIHQMKSERVQRGQKYFFEIGKSPIFPKGKSMKTKIQRSGNEFPLIYLWKFYNFSKMYWISKMFLTSQETRYNFWSGESFFIFFCAGESSREMIRWTQDFPMNVMFFFIPVAWFSP